jgi:hypothetical protein
LQYELSIPRPVKQSTLDAWSGFLSRRDSYLLLKTFNKSDMSGAFRIPLSRAADEMLTALQQATGSGAIAALDGATLLGERATLRGMAVPGLTAANGYCHLYQAAGDRIALNLARASDIEMLPALLECDSLELDGLSALAACIRNKNATALTARGRLMGLAIACESEQHAPSRALAGSHSGQIVGDQVAEELGCGQMTTSRRVFPRVLDLSALWAGPLAAHLLWLAGADVIRVEHRSRPDGMRQDDPAFFGLLNQGKASVVLDFGAMEGRQALLSLIASSDIVIEAARPRGLRQLGIDATALSASLPGLVWITITGYGARGEAADWVGFGDDCGVAGGLSALLREASGGGGFVGDAIADPLTGIEAALVAWTRWRSGRGARLGLAMRDVVANCVQFERALDADRWEASLRSWASSQGQPFPAARRRPMTAAVSALGADTARYMSHSAPLTPAG